MVHFSMDEVWEQITLPSLPTPTAVAAGKTSGAGTNLQDFFLNKDPIIPSHHHHPYYNRRILDSPSPAPGAYFSGECPPPATTELSLKSRHVSHLSRSPKSRSQLDEISPPPPYYKKRLSDSKDGDGACDRRHKRLMKNRESADRSRARRQAYTNELEQEITQLKNENAKLRKQLQKGGFLSTPAPPVVAPLQHLISRKGHSITRTLSATF